MLGEVENTTHLKHRQKPARATQPFSRRHFCSTIPLTLRNTDTSKLTKSPSCSGRSSGMAWHAISFTLEHTDCSQKRPTRMGQDKTRQDKIAHVEPTKQEQQGVHRDKEFNKGRHEQQHTPREGIERAENKKGRQKKSLTLFWPGKQHFRIAYHVPSGSHGS